VSDSVLLEVRDDRVAVLTLNRPDRHNAWTAELEERYFALLDQLDTDPRVRAVVLTGGGGAFCPGFDTERLQQAGDVPFSQQGRRSPVRAWALRKPLVAAVNGGCAGVGLAQALLCDVRFASRTARLATAFTRRGLAGEYGLTWLLPRLIGLGPATDLLLSGRTVGADEALALGLVNRVVEPHELLPAAIAYAADLAAWCSPTSLALVRHQLHVDVSSSFTDALRRSYLAMAHTVAAPDVREGARSFLERRAPDFPDLADDLDPGAVVAARVPVVDAVPQAFLD
jgi:enoyl-CoA hydratase/carnithine racemase